VSALTAYEAAHLVEVVDKVVLIAASLVPVRRSDGEGVSVQEFMVVRRGQGTSKDANSGQRANMCT
jgi:hypothetical protein